MYVFFFLGTMLHLIFIICKTMWLFFSNNVTARLQRKNLQLPNKAFCLQMNHSPASQGTSATTATTTAQGPTFQSITTKQKQL